MVRAGGSVELADVSLTLPPARLILSGISLALAPGTKTALLGRSGSGKTTLLRMVNALVRPTRGAVLVDSKDVLAMDGDALRDLRRRIGYVIQETGLFPHMTIERNVALPMELAGVPLQPRRDAARAMLERVGLAPDSFASRFPHQLSGGQRQRAGLARALVTEPKILLLDEPFGALDPLTRAEMQMLLLELLQESSTTMLLVTHDLREAMRLAETLVFLEDGREVVRLSSHEVKASAHPHVVAYREASLSEVIA